MLWFIFCKDDIVLDADGRIPRADRCPLPLSPWNTIHRLPSLNGENCCCVTVDHPATDIQYQQIGLRASFDVLPAEEYKMAGKAREILYWDANTRYCGVCGSPMAKDSDISKKCSGCGKQVWPPIATAIIVLIRRRVEEREEILMVRAHNFRGNHYGLVAGFLETGESLEECLEREVFEEVGLRVNNIRYRGSQPWPYPAGLMVGYTADYAGGELRLQTSELADGGWYTRDNLPPLPGKVSLARQLIDIWLENYATTP